jgi:hypothetical protein
MSFLAPLFILGGAAIALPIIFHLIRRTTKEQTNFSSLMFLQPTPPRLTRRSRLEHLLLLALRCVALALLAFGFARPLIKRAVAGDLRSNTARKIAMLIDASASMKRANLWADAQDKAAAVLRKASPSDQVAVYTFDRQLHPLVSFEQWNSIAAGERAELAIGRLKEISPGWAASHLGNALISAAEALSETDGKSPKVGSRQIVLISDLKEGSRLDQLQGYEWPKGIEVSVEALGAKHKGNAGLQLVTDSDDARAQSGTNASIRVRVYNAADSQREQFKVGWSDAAGSVAQPMDVYVPPGQNRVAALALPPKGTALDRIRLQGDEEDFDNVVFVVPPEAEKVNVIYFGGDTGSDPTKPLYFLKRAFQETRRQKIQITVNPDSAPSSPTMQHATLLVAADALSDSAARELRAQVEAGKTLLLSLKNEMAAPALARLLALDTVALEEASLPSKYAMLADIDFQHPLFAPFADPRFSDFTRIHFWKYRKLDAAAIPHGKVIAKFDSGDPAMIDAPMGKGRLILMAFGWQPEESQLALSTKFVPLLYSALDYSGAASPPPAQYIVGDQVPVGDDPATRERLNSSATVTNALTAPGIFTRGSTQHFAVNLDPAESRTAPRATDELERLGVPMARAAASFVSEAERKVRLQTAELENRQKLWRWFILATVLVLLVETWLAGWTSRLAVPESQRAS